MATRQFAPHVGLVMYFEWSARSREKLPEERTGTQGGAAAGAHGGRGRWAGAVQQDAVGRGDGSDLGKER